MSCVSDGTSRFPESHGESGPAGSDLREPCGEGIPDCLIGRLPDVVRGVSVREREVLGHVARGATYREVARRMDLSPHTVDTYIRRIRAKTGARNRMHLLLLALSVEGSLVSAVEDLGGSSSPKVPAGPVPEWNRA
ncbi:helix-turn-helix transcriptional regulator [Streptomyces sp. NPDC049916]|uniref:response regulator transcription factor n=1 Tax=Streptomyces sp. NPDC049916 TaxID=3155156 RepID=UPI00341A099A